MRKTLIKVLAGLLALTAAFGAGRMSDNRDLAEDEYVDFNGDVVHVDDIKADS